MKYILIFLIMCYFFSCGPTCAISNPYDYSYYLYIANHKNTTKDSVKIIVDTYNESSKRITKKIYPDTSIYTRQYMIFQEPLSYIYLNETPKDIHSKFGVYLKRVTIYLDDSLVYDENPVKLSNWSYYTREANIFLGGGMDGVTYELKLDSMFKPIKYN